jgi:transposase-like protein
MEGMAEWQNRPLDRVYPVMLMEGTQTVIA